MKRAYPSPALVIACVALFVAMGGTGYAATQLSSGQGRAIASKAAKRGPRGPRGPQGPQGLQGTPGAPGKPGSNAFGALTYVTGPASEIPKEEQGSVLAQCPPGLHVIGGGVESGDETPGESINSSFPSNAKGEAGNTGWVGFVDNSTGKPQLASAYAICAEAGTVTGP
jgi:hypothetical protein